MLSSKDAFEARNHLLKPLTIHRRIFFRRFTSIGVKGLCRGEKPSQLSSRLEILLILVLTLRLTLLWANSSALLLDLLLFLLRTLISAVLFALTLNESHQCANPHSLELFSCDY